MCVFLVLNLFWVFGSLQSSLLCLVGELSGGGSLAVAAALVTGDR